MTQGIRDLRQIQIGFQGLATGTICATPATPTARLVGQCSMTKDPGRVFPTEATGVMSEHIINRSYDQYSMAPLSLTPGDEGVTFQQLPWFLAMGAEGGVTGTGTGTPKTWAFCPDLVNGDLPEVATIRYGDNARVWEASCCFATQLTISAASQAPWQISADVVGRDMETASFETIAYPTGLETILGQMTSFYKDASCQFAASPTVVTGSLIDWTVTVPGFHPKYFQDGALYYTTMGLKSRHLTLAATVEWDSAFAAGEWDNFDNGTPVYVRIEGVGATPANATATIDMVLMYESFETLDERDGNDTIRFTARSVYDVACTEVPEWCITVINTSAALP